MSADTSPFLAHHFDTLEQQRGAQAFGMWAFLGTEVLVFGALFAGYAAYRLEHHAAFEATSAHLNLLIGAVNTVVLLTSSLTMALAVHATQTGRRRLQLTTLVLTAVLGLAFLGLKVVEYAMDYHEKLVPGLAFEPSRWSQAGIDPRHVELFLMFYYILTGLHAAHMIIGLGVLAVVTVRAWLGSFPPENYMGVELMGLYWHFVDIVWIFLLPLLYLAGERISWT
jgi:cytochrome c oxidase subunit 3